MYCGVVKAKKDFVYKEFPDGRPYVMGAVETERAVYEGRVIKDELWLRFVKKSADVEDAARIREGCEFLVIGELIHPANYSIFVDVRHWGVKMPLSHSNVAEYVLDPAATLYRKDIAVQIPELPDDAEEEETKGGKDTPMQVRIPESAVEKAAEEEQNKLEGQDSQEEQAQEERSSDGFDWNPFI